MRHHPTCKRPLLSLVISLVLQAVPLVAREAFIKDGNVFVKNAKDKVVQLTDSGKDLEARLSPDGKSVAFVRDTPGELVGTGRDDLNACEIWLADVDTHKSRLLLKGRPAKKMEDTLCDMCCLRFSLGGHWLYFSSGAWCVSNAIHRICLETGSQEFVIDGLGVRVIPTGKDAGKLLVTRALIKYDKQGESLGRDVYLCLVHLDGTNIREIGQIESKEVANFLKLHHVEF